MLEAFRSHIAMRFPEMLEIPFLLACSGGVDSTVLAHLCQRIGCRFTLAHCNFSLRDKASDNDADFVRNLAQNLDMPFESVQFDTRSFAREQKISIEMAARKLRYDWFELLMETHGLATLATAHHLDDDLETFLINLSRGTGIEGLTGIPERTDSLARPLLVFPRDQIMDFAVRENLQWCEDATNTDPAFLRNKVRHSVVPLLKELSPSFLKSFLRTKTYLQQTAAIADDRLAELRQELFVTEDNRIRIPITALRQLSPLTGYLHGLLKPYGFKEWDNVAHLLETTSGKEVSSSTHRLVRDRDFLILIPIGNQETREYPIQEDEPRVLEPISLTFEDVPGIGKTGPHILYVDRDTLTYPMVLRKWKVGDYFYPFGMKGRKKLSKYFKDEKVDVVSKSTQWLLCSGDDIVWVVGKRADDRFKITDSTTKILRISWF